MERRFLILGSLLCGALSACTVGGGRDLPDVGFNVDTNSPDVFVPDTTPPPDTGPVVCDPGSTIGNACEANVDCQDNCFCNGAEVCAAGVCTADVTDRCDDGIECTMDACDEERGACVNMPMPEMCSDGDACNGEEICDRVLGCRAAAPLYCNDEDSCTVDSCDEVVGCQHEPRDLDGDGFAAGTCGGEDCDDDPRFGTDIFPGAVEDCTNRRDDDCDGLRDFLDESCLPENDDCDSAQELDGPGTYSGSTRSSEADYALGCQPTGPDVVFRFTLEEMQDVRATVGGGGTNAAVAIRPAAMCETGPDVRCNRASPPVVLQRSLPPGEYVIIVKTATASVFDLTLMFEPPTPIPPVDVCNAGTEDISAGGMFTGMFLEVEDDYALSCRTSTASVKDAVYRLELDAPKDVTLVGRSMGGSFTPSTYLSLVTDCSDTSSTITCRSASTNEIRQRGLPAGVYYVILESSSTTASTWSLDVTVTDPLPRNPGDSCDTAIDITSSMGTVPLTMAELDSGTGCGGTSSSFRDVNFSFTLDRTRDVTVTTTAPGFHYTSLSTACGRTGSEIRCRSASTPNVQSYRSLPAGTYYVTSASTSSSGNITAMIETRPPTPVPPNDRCEGAINITGGYVSTDTLIDFEDDVMGCTGRALNDAFYTFTLRSPKQMTAIASRVGGSTSTMYLTLRGAECTGANVQCRSGASPTTLVTTGDLEPGTYHLIVESTSTTASDYDLRVLFD